jgi:acyl-CoA thioester hydrolase
MNIFQLDLTVNATHLDEMHHVNNVVYLTWVQDVSEGHWKALATPEMRQNYYWVALRHELDYKGQGFLNDEILLKTHLIECGGVRSKRAVQIIRKADNQLLMESVTTWILMSVLTNKPARIPPEMLAIFPVN